MGSEAFEATVAVELSESDRRAKTATRLYFELRNNGMSGERANAVVQSVVYDKPVTMTFVEHTGVFGIWIHSESRWAERVDGSLVWGPRCVMQAEMDRIPNLEYVRGFEILEFTPDGRPSVEIVAPKVGE